MFKVLKQHVKWDLYLMKKILRYMYKTEYENTGCIIK